MSSTVTVRQVDRPPQDLGRRLTDPCEHFVQHGNEVDHDLAVLGLQVAGVALEHVDYTRVRTPIDLHPQLLEGVRREEVVHLIAHEPFQRVGQGRGEGLPPLGEHFLEERLGVDRPHQLGGHPAAERLLHRGVFDDWRDGLHPLVGVEGVAACPHARDCDREHDRRDHDQHRGRDAPRPTSRSVRALGGLRAQVADLRLEPIPLLHQPRNLVLGQIRGPCRRVLALFHIFTVARQGFRIIIHPG